MPDYSVIRCLQIEITTHCNLSCPGCGRNQQGGPIQDYLNLMHMDLEVCRKIFTDPFCINNINKIYFNGMFGDPMMHPNIIDIVSMIPNDKIINIHTNGSIRNTKFWKELADLCGHKKLFVTWSVDGLEDTNHIHRRGSQWNKILTNMQAFNRAGGISEWRWVVFDHNIHQLEQARNIAIALGFKSFELMNSYAQQLPAVAYKNYQEQVITAPAKDKIVALKQMYDFNYLDKFISAEHIEPFIPIHSKCSWYQQHIIQIGSDGRILPCCYTANEFYSNDFKDEIWNAQYLDHNRIQDYTLNEILSNQFFSNELDQIFESTRSAVCDVCIKDIFTKPLD